MVSVRAISLSISASDRTHTQARVTHFIGEAEGIWGPYYRKWQIYNSLLHTRLLAVNDVCCEYRFLHLFMTRLLLLMWWFCFRYVLFSFTLDSLWSWSVAALQLCSVSLFHVWVQSSSCSPAFYNPVKVLFLIQIGAINLLDVYIYCFNTAGMFPFPADIEAWRAL